MTKLEQVARALAVYQFGSDESWEDQIPMARVAVEAMRLPTNAMLHAGRMPHPDRDPSDVWSDIIDAILSEKPE